MQWDKSDREGGAEGEGGERERKNKEKFKVQVNVQIPTTTTVPDTTQERRRYDKISNLQMSKAVVQYRKK